MKSNQRKAMFANINKMKITSYVDGKKFNTTEHRWAVNPTTKRYFVSQLINENPKQGSPDTISALSLKDLKDKVIKYKKFVVAYTHKVPEDKVKVVIE